jgi:hypothetical protein
MIKPNRRTEQRSPEAVENLQNLLGIWNFATPASPSYWLLEKLRQIAAEKAIK